MQQETYAIDAKDSTIPEKAQPIHPFIECQSLAICETGCDRPVSCAVLLQWLQSVNCRSVDLQSCENSLCRRHESAKGSLYNSAPRECRRMYTATDIHLGQPVQMLQLIINTSPPRI